MSHKRYADAELVDASTLLSLVGSQVDHEDTRGELDYSGGMFIVRGPPREGSPRGDCLSVLNHYHLITVLDADGKPEKHYMTNFEGTADGLPVITGRSLIGIGSGE